MKKFHTWLLFSPAQDIFQLYLRDSRSQGQGVPLATFASIDEAETALRASEVILAKDICEAAKLVLLGLHDAGFESMLQN